MNEDTKRRIELVIDEAVALATGGMDPWGAARYSLVAQQSDVYRELAIAAIVDVVERRARAEALEVERAAERHQRTLMAERVASDSAARSEQRRADEIRRANERAELDAKFQRSIKGMMDRFVDELRVEWTAELLDTTVALGDGTRIKWGDATAEQHAQRAEMLERNAGANFEAASRHRFAIRELASAGAVTLREMVGVRHT